MTKQFAVFCLLAVVSTAVLAQGPPKPIWPIEFTSPFGLNMLVPPTHNASAMLYYNWNVKSQRVDYTEHCLPFISARSYFYPCKLYFNPSGIYVAQPLAGNPCCLFVPNVGSIPPRFLDPFNFSNVEPAADMWGKMRTCNHWVGIDGFAYWTDVNTEEDVQFKDGNTGVFWNFGTFNTDDVDPSLFNLPEDNCNVKCNALALGLDDYAANHLTSMYHIFNKMGSEKYIRRRGNH